MPQFETDESARLLAIADSYLAQAAAARDLATAIDQRRIFLTSRLDPCMRRHLPDVWSSNAAEISRTKLNRMIARDVYLACDQLLQTRVALVAKAEASEAQAFALQHRVTELNNAKLAIATDPSTSRSI